MDRYLVIFITVMIILFINYWAAIVYSRMKVRDFETKEGFSSEDKEDKEKEKSEAESTVVKWLEPPELFDDFYCQVYDQLTQSSIRLQAEVGLALHAFKAKGALIESMTFLDAGCGSGIATAALAKLNPKKVIAVDLSKSMIQRTKKITLEDSTLTQAQKDRIEFREGNLLDAGIIKPGEITNAICLYFVIYYMRDIEAFFRNMFVWVRPGGMMAIEVVPALRLSTHVSLLLSQIVPTAVWRPFTASIACCEVPRVPLWLLVIPTADRSPTPIFTMSEVGALVSRTNWIFPPLAADQSCSTASVVWICWAEISFLTPLESRKS